MVQASRSCLNAPGTSETAGKPQEMKFQDQQNPENFGPDFWPDVWLGFWLGFWPDVWPGFWRDFWPGF